MRQPSEQDSGPKEVVPVPNVVRAERMEGEDDEDTALLQEMLVEARNYILSFPWCESILGSYFAGWRRKDFCNFPVQHIPYSNRC